MKKLYVILLAIFSLTANAALETNLDSVTVGSHLYPKSSNLPLGSTTAYWSAFLSGLSGSVTNDASTGNIDALSTTNRYHIRLTGAAPVLRGIAGGSAGKEIIVINASGVDISVKDADANPAAADQILTGTGADMDLKEDGAFRFAYDATSARWRIAGGGGGGIDFIAVAPIAYDTVTKFLTCDVASGAQPGCLSAANWTTFNSKQAGDATLTALAAFNSDGLLTQTAADTFAARTLAAPAAGLTITNPGGVAGNPTFALANDLSALEGLGGTGFAARTATDTWAQRSLVAPAAGFSIANAAGIAGDPTFSLANDLAALEAMAGTGLVARTGAETYAQRTITAGSGVSISNGDGVSGNPTISSTIKPGLNLATLDTAGNSWAASKPDNYDAEGSVGDWLAYADAAGTIPVDMTGGAPNTTCTRNTSSPINGAADFLMTVTTGATRQGEGCSLVVNIPTAYRGKPLKVSFPFATTGTISGDDFVAYAYDVTNGTLLAPSNTISTIVGTSGIGHWQFISQTSTAQLRIGIHIARASNTGAVTIAFDDFKVEPELYQANVPISDWAQYTPTFTNFGSVSTQTFWWRRVGDSVEIRGRFAAASVTNSEARISLPNSIVIDSTKVSNRQQVGNYIRDLAVGTTDSHGGGMLASGGDSFLNFGHASTYGNTSINPLNKADSNQVLPGGSDFLSLWAIIPINGWSSGGGTSPIFSLSDWNSSTITWTPSAAAFGTITNKVIQSRRVGDTMVVNGQWTNGTVAASTAQIDLTSLNFDTTKLGAASQYIRVGTWTKVVSSGGTEVAINSGDREGPIFYDGSDTNSLFLGYRISGSDQYEKINGSSFFNSSTRMDISFSIPISGWTSTSSGTLTAPRSEVRLSTFAGYGSTSTKRPYFTTTRTRGNALTITTNNSTLGNKVTVNISGLYFANAFCQATAAAPAFAAVMRATDSVDATGTLNPEDSTFVNDTHRLSYSGTGDAATPAMGNASWFGYLEAGEYLEIRTRGGTPATAALCSFTVAQAGN